MFTFKVEQAKTGAMVEIWRNGKFVAALYAHDEEHKPVFLNVISKFIDIGEVEVSHDLQILGRATTSVIIGLEIDEPDTVASITRSKV